MQNDLEVTNKLLFEMVKNLKKTNENMKETFIFTIIGFVAVMIFGIVGFFVYESQFETAEQTTTQTELSLDQEASGENAEINNALGNIYKDNSTHNEDK